MLSRIAVVVLALAAAPTWAQDKKDEKKDDKKTEEVAADKKADPKKDDKKDEKKDDKKDDKKKDDKAAAEAAAPATVPALPPPAVEGASPPVETPPASDAAGTAMSAEEIQKLKAQIKAELETELKAQLQNEMEAAARDAATQKAAAQEWEEERWVEEVKPTLNFLELDGYFRTRFDLFNRLDLGTFDPNAGNGVGRGTSSVPPPTMYRPFDGENCTDDRANFPGDECSSTKEDNSSLLSMNMRLRLDPTLNVSEDIRVRTTFDVFDNLVMGSTPESLPGFAQNPTLPLPLFAASQNAPQAGLNSMYDAIRFKRLWAEVTTPLGQLRFGRMAQQFGLGLLANDGNKLDQDYGDSADQLMFATRIAGHYIVPSYSLSSTGPNGRGGGAGIGGDNGLQFYPGENGQRYNLDPKDDVHSIILVVAKRDKEEDITEQVRNGGIVLNYGVFGVYRTQQYDVPNYYTKPGGQAVTSNPVVQPEEYIRRNANAGIGSLWGRFQWDKLRIEAEFVGILGKIDGTATTSQGIDTIEPDMQVIDGNKLKDMPLWILQGGAALESSYKFLNDQLTVGLDAGIASGDDSFGWGLRPVTNPRPKPGDFDGRQYGECLDRGEGDRNDDGVVDCKTVDDNVTNFRFDPDYQIDLILFREILGTVTDAFYVKPHIGYNLTENLGARADVIYSHAIFASSTTGQQNPIGLEIDGTGYYGTEDGFYLMVQYGFFLPFGALSHYAADVEDQFVQPQFAQTFQVFGGVQF